MKYDLTEPSLFLFDIRINNQYVDYSDFIKIAQELNLPVVPLLYQGPYSKDTLNVYTNGDTVLGNGKHIREGCVVKPIKERLGGKHMSDRIILKSVSEAYLFRDTINATEFN